MYIKIKKLLCFFTLGLIVLGSQAFASPILQQLSPTATSYVDQVDFDVMSFSAVADVTGIIIAVDLELIDTAFSALGCEATDFASFVSGSIALLQRGACTYNQKAFNAETAGAIGVLIFNQGNSPDRTGVVIGTLGSDGIGIPVFGTTFAFGETFSATAGVQMRMVFDGVTAVPIPATLSLFGIGLIGLCWHRRKLLV